MGIEMTENARVCTRISFTTRAEVDVDGEILDGTLQDISMNGLYFRSDASVAVGDACEVRIFLGDEDPMVMHALSYVARCDADGFALSFSGFYCDSASHLQQVILLNVGDKDQVMDELEKAPKLTTV
ncbi:MAG: PilZ domain-containing protein [Mariprofundaceae bacterium]